MAGITQKKLDFKFVYFLMTVLITFSISASVLGTLMFDFSFIGVFILSLTACFFYFILFYKLKAGIILMSIITAGFTIFSLCTYYIDSLGAVIPIGDSIDWFMQYNFNYEPVPTDGKPYVQIITFLIVVIIALLLYFIIYRKELLYVTAVLSLAAYSFQISSNYSHNRLWNNNFNIPFFINIFLLIMFYFLHSYKKRKERIDDGYVNPAKYLRLTIFITALIFLFIILMPKPDSSVPVSGWLDEQVWLLRDNISNFIMRNIFMNNSNFNLSSTGYSADSQQLGGPVLEDTHTALKVKTKDDTYLRGTVKENYTGHVWRILEKKDYGFDDKSNPSKLDLTEMNFSKTLVNKKLNPDDMWSTYNINVSYQRIVTKSIFTPLKDNSISFVKPGQFSAKVNVNSTTEADRECPFIFEYNVSGYQLNYNFSDTLNVLRKSYKGLYNSYKTVPAGISQEDFNALKQNSEKIYSKYTQIPSSMPARVMELARKVTANDKSNFDKVKAIESYLAFNYKYNTKPSVAPINQDFVDYFLFDDRQGYCTYYASAMVMMVRSIGIPARYVEGYRVDATPSGQEYTNVVNSNGHSWVEVYFEGVGWINFEPTTVYYDLFYSQLNDNIRNQFRINPGDPIKNNEQFSPPQKPISDVKPVQDVTPDPDVTPKPTSTVIPAGTNGEDPSGRAKQTEGVGLSPMKTPGPKQDETGSNAGKAGIILLIITSGSIFSAWLIYNFKRTGILLAKAIAMDNNAAVIFMFKYYLKVFKSLGYSYESDETALEYMTRLSGENAFSDLSLKSVFDIFMKARYGNASVSDEEKSEALAFVLSLAAVAKSSLGPVTYYFYKIVLGQV